MIDCLFTFKLDDLYYMLDIYQKNLDYLKTFKPNEFILNYINIIELGISSINQELALRGEINGNK